MPQGSDYHQRKVRQEIREQNCLEKAFKEVEQLRGRVRYLEEIVAQMARKLDMPVESWDSWKL